MKKIMAVLISAALLMPLVFGNVLAQQDDFCRLDVRWLPPGYYADDQCIDVSDDPIAQTQKDMLMYRFRAKPEGDETWTIVSETDQTDVQYNNLACGNYEVEVTPHFPGQTPDCPVTEVKEAKMPRPGSCAILP
jgi:hypothetical protein